MNYLGVNCSVENKFGRVIIVILSSENEVFRQVFRSPSVFSFKKNSAEILNWHRDNIISLISQFNIQGIVVKKTERTSFSSRIKNSGIFKLYLEGVILSLAGNIGKLNKHFYKTDIQTILQAPNVFDLDINAICDKYSLKNSLDNIPATEKEATKEALLAVISLKSTLIHD
jgi:hypothetical protein